jgi:hypothetical protein
MSLSPGKLAAGAGATVTSMVLGSFFGDSGTVYGAAIGSVTYSVAAEGYEYLYGKGHATVKKVASKHRKPVVVEGENWPPPKASISPLEERVRALPGGAEALASAPQRREEARRKYENRHRAWKLALSGAAMAGVGVAVSFGVLSVTEASTGKTLSSYFPGNTTHYGSSIGSASTKPPPSPSPQVHSPSASGGTEGSPTTIPSPSLTITPSQVPTVTPSPFITSIPVTATTAPVDPAPTEGATGGAISSP